MSVWPWIACPACPLRSFLHAVCGRRYWLWYTTQRIVSGTVRKVYQKLKQFKVQFLVLQRRTDPSQVMLQCLPSNKVCSSSLFIHLQPGPEHMEKSPILLLCAQVDTRVQSLAELYDGPQPSDMCDLLEGEQFFAGFERGLDISTGVKVVVQVPGGLFSCCCSQSAGVPQRDRTAWREGCALCFTPA